MISSQYSMSRGGSFDARHPIDGGDEDEELYSGFNDVSPALDTRSLREDQAFQEALRTAGIGRKLPSRMGTGMFRQGTVSLRMNTSARGPTTAGGARPMTAVRAAGYTSTARSTPSLEDRREESIEDKVKQMEARIMTLVEESCTFSARAESEDSSSSEHSSDVSQKPKYDLGKALAKAQEASTLERQLIRMQEQANLGDTHNLDLTFSVLCNLAGQYALNEMYTEALNTYQLLTRNKLFPHANRLKVNMGNIYFKMGEHPKALKLYRMALDQTPTAEKDLRMKVMHNIGLLLVRMGKFRDAVTNFQHIMHEQGDFQTGLHLVLCSVALNDAEGGKAAFHAMLDVEPPTYHHDLPVDDESSAYGAVLRDVVVGDRLARWSRAAAAHAERCLALAAAALAPLLPATAAVASASTSVSATAAAAAMHRDEHAGMWWCVEALRGWEAGGAGARLELGAALAALRAGGVRSANGVKALQRLKAVARAHPNDQIVRAEANADAAFVAYALGNWSEATTLSETACREDPYSCAARVTAALAAVRGAGQADGAGEGEGEREAWGRAAHALAAAAHLDPADHVAIHDIALASEAAGGAASAESAAARWTRVRGGGAGGAGAGGTLRAFAAAGLARLHHAAADTHTADHWYSSIGTWDAGVTEALARLHAELGDATTAKLHYQDVEAAWPCSAGALEWLGAEARAEDPALALTYYRRAARLQPNNAQWGLLLGGCLRASGRYQEALSLYKKMNVRFPENVQCLKLIVKLCGDQGLAETAAWSRELQRAQARHKQSDRASVPSAGSGSSGTSQSPIDLVRGARADSAGRSQLSTASSGTAALRAHDADDTYRYASESSAEETKPIGRSIYRSAGVVQKIEEFDDDLPLPPE